MADPPTAPLTVALPDAVAEVRFDGAMEREIEQILSRYPTTPAALLPVLWRCQDRWGWISPGITRAVANRLGLSPAFVEGVLTFYTMYHRQPPGRYVLQVCTTLSCQLCGTGGLVDHLKQKLGVDFGETTADGRFTLKEGECMGACAMSPVVLVNNKRMCDFMSKDKLDALIDELAGKG